ncbi:MAG: type IV pilus secretin PilQ [Nitrospirota bacterium]|nr:type IV pilus secretin PilQ [Nitrospirota bacterium]
MKRLILSLIFGALFSAPFALAQGTFETDGPRWQGEKISLDFQDAQVRQVLQLIADVSGRNVVISDAVSGTVTLKLKKVPWDQALDLVLKTGGLGMEDQGEILRIDTLENLARQRDEASRARAGIVSSEALVTRLVPVHYATPSKIAELIEEDQGTTGGSVLSSRGSVSVEERTKTLIIKDIESNIELVVALIEKLDRPTPQVTIEARVVQVIPQYKRELGITWSATGAVYSSSSTLAPSARVTMPAGFQNDIGFNFGRLIGSPVALDMRLSAGETQGFTKIVSSPKITVLDNQKAIIKSGQEVPYLSLSDRGTEVTMKEAVLSLEVTPTITGDGRVTLQIKIKKDEPQDGVAPRINKREAETVVLVGDGDTTVIGGIFDRIEERQVERVPFFSKLPLIGFLFQKQTIRDDVQELLIFITPRIG